MYVYVGNDPINRIDPSGQDAWSATANFFAGVGEGAAGAWAVSAAVASGTIGGAAVAVAAVEIGCFYYCN